MSKNWQYHHHHHHHHHQSHGFNCWSLPVTRAKTNYFPIL